MSINILGSSRKKKAAKKVQPQIKSNEEVQQQTVPIKNDELESEDEQDSQQQSDNESDESELENTTEENTTEEVEQVTFSDIGVEPWLESHLAKLDIRLPTIIQEKCIPPALEGKNIIGMSNTGSGKTATFALPIIQSLAKDMFGIYALIITPTRELALQIRSHFVALAGDLPLRVALLTGGLDYLKQAHILDKKPHVVVGTPGRIEAAMRLFSNDGYFKKIKYLVFDEADRLLGTSDYTLDMDIILKHINPNRQTILFSATMNSQVKKLAKIAMQKINPDKLFIFDACRLYSTADQLKQHYLFMPQSVRDCYLLELLENLKPEELCMVFFCAIKDCELAMRTCRLLGINCDSLHASKPQKERFRVLQKFRNRSIQVLFATDVGNRGLDIPSVNMVVNYDLPDTTDRYVHRVGRTARAGRSGLSVSLISQYDVSRIKSIEADTRVKMEKWTGLDEKKAEDRLYQVAEKRVQAKMEMLDQGFQDAFEDTKNRQRLTRGLREEANVFYEMQYLNKLKSGNKWKSKLKDLHKREYDEGDQGSDNDDGPDRKKRRADDDE